MNAGLIEKEGFAALVLRLRSEGISDLDLLTAVEKIPRTKFVPAPYQASAYSSRSIPIDCGSFLEGADQVVRILAKMQLKPGLRVLEIGTGSGYMTAVLAKRVERVISLERYKRLVKDAQARMDDLSIRNVFIRQMDGSNGLVGEGTFDRIVATVAFPDVPRFFTEQIVSGGMMLVPIIREDGKVFMNLVSKTGSRIERHELFETQYLPYETHIARFL